MTSEMRMLWQQPESGERGGKERKLRWRVGVQRGRRVMIGWKRKGEERRRGVQRGLKQEEKNERRAKE